MFLLTSSSQLWVPPSFHHHLKEYFVISNLSTNLNSSMKQDRCPNLHCKMRKIYCSKQNNSQICKRKSTYFELAVVQIILVLKGSSAFCKIVITSGIHVGLVTFVIHILANKGVVTTSSTFSKDNFLAEIENVNTAMP